MSKQKFEFYDLLAFTLIASVMEVALEWCFNAMHAPFTLSVSLVLGLIAMIRWNAPGIAVTVIAGLAGAVTGVVTDPGGKMVWTNWRWFLSNTLGYLPVLFNLFWFANGGKKRIEERRILGVAYVITGFLLADLGRSLFYIGSSQSVNRVVMMFFVYDLINLVVAIALYLLASHQKDLVTDMNAYLIRVHKGTPESNKTEELRDEDDLTGLMQVNDKDEVNDISLLDGGMVSQEQLEEQEKVRLRMEGKSGNSKFDKENNAIRNISKDKSKKKKE